MLLSQLAVFIASSTVLKAANATNTISVILFLMLILVMAFFVHKHVDPRTYLEQVDHLLRPAVGADRAARAKQSGGYSHDRLREPRAGRRHQRIRKNVILFSLKRQRVREAGEAEFSCKYFYHLKSGRVAGNRRLLTGRIIGLKRMRMLRKIETVCAAQ